uniref:Peptidase aspartic putative domain-containing protein n=1 Tax=Trichogramma kaykai TaxID=54128 RepID=A0ABD2VX91_9HYME
MDSARVLACLYLHDIARERRLPIEVYGLQRIGIKTPSQPLPPATTQRFQELELADPEPHKPRPVDAILGADVYNKILLPGLIRHGGIIAQCTIFGWILTGRITHNVHVSSSSVHHYNARVSKSAVPRPHRARSEILGA